MLQEAPLEWVVRERIIRHLEYEKAEREKERQKASKPAPGGGKWMQL